MNISGMKISISATWSIQDPSSDPPTSISLTATGETQFVDISPPTSRRLMRCGTGASGAYARRGNWKGYGRFAVDTFTGVLFSSSDEAVKITEPDGDGGTRNVSGFAWVGEDNGFVSGLYEPWETSDPWYKCAKGIWDKATEVTKNSQLSLVGWISNVPWDGYSTIISTMYGYAISVIYHSDSYPYTADVLTDFGLRGVIERIKDGAQITWQYRDPVSGEYSDVGSGQISYQIAQQ